MFGRDKKIKEQAEYIGMLEAEVESLEWTVAAYKARLDRTLDDLVHTSRALKGTQQINRDVIAGSILAVVKE